MTRTQNLQRSRGSLKTGKGANTQFENFSFGSPQIDDSTYERDVIIDRGEIRKRLKKPSKKFREDFGHTPLSVEEDIPWKCTRLVVGTGAYEDSQ